MSATLGTALGNATAMTALLRNGSSTANNSVPLLSGHADNATGIYEWNRTNDTDLERENIGQAVAIFYAVLVRIWHLAARELLLMSL